MVFKTSNTPTSFPVASTVAFEAVFVSGSLSLLEDVAGVDDFLIVSSRVSAAIVGLESP